MLECVVTKTQDRKPALKFLRKLRRRYGRPEQIVTDRLRSYGAALRELGAGARQHSAQHANNRVENLHLPFRRQERAMLRFRQMKTLQLFAAVHASVSNHFNHFNHFNQDRSRRPHYKQNRTAALAEWRQFGAA